MAKKYSTLFLKDGTRFKGQSFGADTSTAGEVVFNTGMVGYPESFTDPSYAGQILVCTYPLIGNYGVPDDALDKWGLEKHFESSKIQISGLIVASYVDDYSHHQATRSLAQWLKEQNIPAITGIDTRALTQKLRTQGAMLGKIVLGGKREPAWHDPNTYNIIKEVSTKKVVEYSAGQNKKNKKIILIDCGVKNNIIRSFLERGVDVIRVPWNYNFLSDRLKNYNGIFISNGPGNPKKAKSTIEILQRALRGKKPILGICMGNLLLGLAAGGDTYKLKFGHRSQNQPCTHVDTGRCYITSQNHGYAVDIDKMPKGWEPLFFNANDGTHEGMRHNSKPFMSVQFHPEATPGPVDTSWIFDDFISGL